MNLKDELEIVPQPPTTNKKTLYATKDISLFSDLEERVNNLHGKTSRNMTFDQLMDKLLIHSLSDMEKARILYNWVTCKKDISFQRVRVIRDDTYIHSLHGERIIRVKEDTPFGYLYDIEETKQGRQKPKNWKTKADLYKRLCVAAGLQSKIITGYRKAYGYVPDHVFNDDRFHQSWNAVLIDGEWRLIDTNFGSSCVVFADPTQITPNLVNRYEEHYFLTDPDQFINDHFPDQKKWQLLDKPLTIEEFQKQPQQWPIFYKLGLRQHSHHQGVVQVDESGYVQIKLFSPLSVRKDARFTADLYTKDGKRHVGRKLLERQHFNHTEGQYEIFHICLPATGSYLLEIRGMSKKFHVRDGTRFYKIVTIFQLNCPRIEQSLSSNHVFNPQFPGRYLFHFYGISLSAYDINLINVTPPNGIVECDINGEASVALSFKNNKFLNFAYELRNIDDLQFNDRCMQLSENHHDKTTNEEILTITIQIRAPYDGNFALILFESHVHDAQVLKRFATFLVVSRALIDGTAAPSFPSTARPNLVTHVMDDL